MHSGARSDTGSCVQEVRESPYVRLLLTCSGYGRVPEPECVEDDNEVLELGGEAVELLIQPGEQAGLAIDPGSVIWLGLLGHCSVSPWHWQSMPHL